MGKKKKGLDDTIKTLGVYRRPESNRHEFNLIGF